MKHCKALFLLLTFFVMSPTNSTAVPSKEPTYTRSQVDSIVSAAVQSEVAKQVDTVLIGYKIDKATCDRLGTYITAHDDLVSDKLTLIGIAFTVVVTVLAAIVGIGFPMRQNKEFEKMLEGLKTQQAESQKIQSKIKEQLTQSEKRQEESEERLKESNKKFEKSENKLKESERKLKEVEDKINKILAEVNASKEAAKASKDEAEQSAKEAKASQLFAQAFSEIDSSKAVDLYSQAIELKPDFAGAYNNRGNRKKIIGDNAGALADYNKAIELKPDFAYAFNNRGILKKNMDDKDGALADYNKAIELKPDYAEAYNNRGILKKNMDDKDGALADYNKAIELNPDYAKAYNNRATCYRELAQNEQDEQKKAILIAKAEADKKKAHELRKQGK